MPADKLGRETLVGRPPIWTPFRRVHWLSEYEYTSDGRIRDKSRNVLPEYAPDYQVKVRVAGGRRAPFNKRELLALEWFDTPPRADCSVCGEGKGPYYRIVHLDGNRRNSSRDNLKYVIDDVAVHLHERGCFEQLMWSPSRVAWGPDYVSGCHSPNCRCYRCGG